MATDIANLAVIISSNPAPMVEGFKQADAAAGNFAESVKGKLKDIGGLLGSAKGGDMFGLAKGISGMAGFNLDLMGMAKGALGKAGPMGAIAAEVLPEALALGQQIAEAVWSQVMSGRKSAKDQMALIRQFNITSESAAGMQVAFQMAGTSIDEVRPVLGRFHRTLGQAAAGSVEARNHFRQLGVDADALAKMPLDQAMQTVAGKFKAIKDPAEKARLAFEIFGRQGAEALKMIDKLADLPNFKNMATFYRTTLSDVAQQRLKAWQDAERMAGASSSSALQGVQQQMAVSAAPLATAANQAFQGFVEVNQPYVNLLSGMVGSIFDNVGNVIEGVQALLEPFAPAFHELLNLADEFGKIFLAIFAGDDGTATFKDMAKQLAENMVPAAKTLAEFIKGIAGWAKAFRDWLKEAGTFARNTASTITFGIIPAAQQQQQQRPANEAASEQRALVAQSVDEMARALGRQAQAAGGATNAVQMLELAERGATEAQLNRIRTMTAQNAVNTIRTEARQQQESIRMQMAGLRDTTEASRSARDVEIELQLLRQGAGAFMWANVMRAAVAQQRLTEAMQRQLTIERQIVALGQQWREQAVSQLEVTENQRAGMSAGQAQRQAQIAALQRQLAANVAGFGGGWFDAIATRARIAALRTADFNLTLAEMMERGRQLDQQFRNPLEVFNDGVADLSELLANGAVEWETYARGVERAFEAMAQAADVAAPGTPHALEAGTVAAQQAQNEARREQQRGQESQQERVARIMEQIQRQNEAAQATREEMLKALREAGLIEELDM